MRAGIRALVLMVALAASGLPRSVEAASDAAGFDGTWSVVALCPATGGGTSNYTLQFTAQVTAGVLHGVYAGDGKTSSLTLDGSIQPDGTAKFTAKGRTGDSSFSQNNAKPGTPYGYDVTATFKGNRGSGTRVGGRVCNYTFVRG